MRAGTAGLHPAGMSTATLASSAPAPAVPARVKAGALLALPLCAMTMTGVVIFWEWSWSVAPVGALALAIAACAAYAAAGVLRGRPGARGLLVKVMAADVAYSIFKLVGWSEPEALTFGAVALVVIALVHERKSRDEVR